MVKGYLFAIVSAVIYGCMPLMAKVIYGYGIAPMSLVLLRNLLAVPILGILAYGKEKSLSVPIKALPVLSIIAFLGACITPILLFCSYQFMDSGTATVFHFIYPAVVVAVGMLFFHKNKAKENIVSVVMCVLGIVLFYNPEKALDLRGCTLALLSGITYAAYVLLLSQFQHSGITGYKFSFYIALISSIFMLPICLVGGQLTLPATAEGWIYCGIFAFVITVGAVFLFQQSTFLIGGEKTSILCTLEPITSVVLGAVIFHEQVSFRVGVGSALVIGAGVLIALTDMRKKKENDYECY